MRRRRRISPDGEYLPRRPPLDRTSVKYLVYRLHDGAGTVIYVGRSSNPYQRIRTHISDGIKRSSGRTRDWVFEARRVSMVGPYNWADACRVERAEIEAHQPRGNRMHTERYGYRRLTNGGGRIFGGGPKSQELTS